MDIDVSGWILEFLLRQDSIDNRSLNDLISVLPLPNNNPRMKKCLILRKIDSDIAKGKISERTIEFLHQIEELDIREGDVEVSEAMKAAYCTVAMYCTAKSIEENVGDKKENIASVVKRIWSGRVREMEMYDVAKIAGLVDDDLLRSMNDIKAGILDVHVCENVVAKFKGLDVGGVLRRYVDEAKEKMGPSFLELAFETILSDPELTKIMGLDEGGKPNNQTKNRAPTVGQDGDTNANDNSKDNEACRANVLPRHKYVAPRSRRGPGHGTHRGAKIVDPMETSDNIHDSIPTPEVNKVQATLETSPLVEAHDNAEAPGSSHDRKGKALEASGDDDGFCRDQNKRLNPNLMGQNNTGHTIELNDSVDSSEKGSPTRPHLPNPKKRPVSPLSIYKSKKPSRYRKKRRWTVIEEDTLRAGVQKYGKGNWKLILSLYRNTFADRTEVDLKDKWRNLTR